MKRASPPSFDRIELRVLLLHIYIGECLLGVVSKREKKQATYYEDDMFLSAYRQRQVMP